MSKNKKMTITSLQREASKLFTKKAIKVGDYEVFIDEKFKPSLVREMINELIKKQEYCEQNEIAFNPTVYLVVLLLDKFTSIDVPEEYDKKIQLLSLLENLEYLEPIMSAFDEKETKKIQDMVKTYAGNLHLMLAELTKEFGKEEVEVVDSKDSVE